MTKIYKFILATLLLFTVTAFAELSEGDKAKVRGAGMQLLVNPGFESGKGDWTMSGSGAFAIVTSGSNLLSGKGSATFDAAAASDYIQSPLYTIPNGLYGRNCYVEMLYLGGDTNYSLQVLDGSSNVLGSTALVAATIPTKAYFNFICPSSGTMRVRVTSSANAAIMALDNFVFGEAINIANISQAQAILIAKRSSSDQAIASVSPTAIVLNDDTLLDVYDEFNSSTGVWTAKSTKRIAVYANIYMDRVQNNEQIAIDVYKDGGAYCSSVTSTYATDTNLGGIVSACIIDVVPGTTIQLWVNSTADNDFDINQGNATRMTILQFPTTQEMAIRPDLQFWKVDANIAGASPSLGTASVSSYTGIEDASLTLTNNSGQGNIAAQIPCSSTNSPSGTTCSSGSESVGVAFTPTGTFPQDVLACASFAHNINLGASGVVDAAFQIIETPTNAQTISQEGKSRVANRYAIASSSASFPMRVCGNFTFTSGGQKVLRLMYEQAVTATVTASQVMGDASASVGQRDIHWEVYPINQGIPAPLLVGSVVHDSVNVKAGGDNGVTSISSGTYTPTITNVTNIASSSAGTWQWTRIGKVVSLSGYVSVQPTAAAPTLSDIGISIPVASNFTDTTGASGNCVGDGPTSAVNQSGFVFSSAANDRMELNFNATSTSNREWRCTVTYYVY